MTTLQTRYKSIHLVYWIYFFSYSLIYDKVFYPNGKLYFLSTALYFLSLMFIFYSSYFLLLFFDKNIFFAISIFILFYLIGTYIDKWILENTSLYAPEIPSEKNIPLYEMFLTYRSHYLDNHFWSVVIFMFEKNISKNKQKILLSTKKRELNFNNNFLLKNKLDLNNSINQILNSFEGKKSSIYQDIKEVQSYLNYYINSYKVDFLSLKDELNSVDIFINLNQKRFKNKFLIDKKYNTEFLDIQIPSMCIITLVENAFKHGDIEKEPLIINVESKYSHIRVFIKNKISTDIKDSSNIGLKNLNKRMKILLKDKYLLNWSIENNYYITTLEIFN